MSGERPVPLLRTTRFATFWSGQAVSTFGDRVTELALPLIAITLLQASPLTVGLLVAAVWAPNLLSVVVGAWVERRASKQRLLIAANLIQAGAVASIPLAQLLGGVGLIQLFVVAVVQGAGGVLAHTASQPFFVRLVPRSRYVEANALLSGSQSASFIAGPPLGGLLIGLLGAPVAMAVDAVSFLFAAGTLTAVEVDESRTPPPPSSLRHEIASGVRFVFTHAYLRPALACVTTANFFSYVLNGVLIVFAVRTLGLTAFTIGLALGIGAVGGLLGAFAAGALGRRFGAGRCVAAGAVLFAAPFAVLPVAATLPAGGPVGAIVILTAVQFVSSAGVMIFDIHLNAIQTTVTPDPMRSRRTGVFGTVNYGVRPIGAALGGLLGGLVGIPTVVVIAAVGGTAAVCWLIGSPVLQVRRADELHADPDEMG